MTAEGVGVVHVGDALLGASQGNGTCGLCSNAPINYDPHLSSHPARESAMLLPLSTMQALKCAEWSSSCLIRPLICGTRPANMPFL
jgi:hypothetical protein